MDNNENYIGKLFDKRYLIESIVGEGGMALVMKAKDTTNGRTVSVKLLTDNEKTAIERFTVEAKAVALLSHKNIVTVHDIHLEGDAKYIVMEYISGITLKEYFDKKGRLEWHEAVHYINQVLEALSHAHSKGVIHRDIKPENVMLLRNGEVKLIDFGIAKLPDSKSITVIDKAIGTVNYISPEQASGRPSSEKSDIYSTGIMLYQFVTGSLPYVSDSSVSVAMMHVSSEPPMPTTLCKSLPRGLEQIIIKAIMKSPERRFGSAQAMRKSLEYLLLNPEIKFKEKVVLGSDGKPITGTGASENKHKVNIKNRVEENEMRSDEEQSRASMLPIVLGVTLAFFTVAVISLVVAMNKFGITELLSLEPRDNEENTVIIPQLVGETYTQWLSEELSGDGYLLEVKYVTNIEAEKNEIISQEPSAKSERKIVKDGIPLTLYVNSGSSEITLDDYRITDEREATFVLEELGLRTKVVEEFSDTVINGYVIRTEPSEGTVLKVGDTVTLYVSMGQEKNTVKMPNIIGMTASQAERELVKKGISISSRSYATSDEYPDGTVIDVSIQAGESVTPKFTSVDITISKSDVSDKATQTMITPDFFDNAYDE